MKARRPGFLGQSSLKFPLGAAWTETFLSRFRLEKAITNWKPGKIKTDPTTNFWTVYKKVADEHDNDLVSKYVGDLDTSLLFVSAFTSPARLVHLAFFYVRLVYSRPLLQLSLSK